MAYQIGAVLASSGGLTDVDSSARNVLGTVVMGSDGKEYIYLQGVASVAAGDWVVYNSAFLCTRGLNTPVSGPAAVALAAVVASKYGWFQIGGKVAVAAIATDSAADGKALFTSSSAGRATTTAAAGVAILGAWGSGAAASNVGAALLNRPFCPGFTLASA